MRIIYSPAAQSDIIEILRGIRPDNEPAATAVAIAIKVTISRLRKFPYMASLTQERDVYMKIARPYEYLIFYEIVDDSIVILAVRHPARKRPRFRQ